MRDPSFGVWCFFRMGAGSFLYVFSAISPGPVFAIVNLAARYAAGASRGDAP